MVCTVRTAVTSKNVSKCSTCMSNQNELRLWVLIVLHVHTSLSRRTVGQLFPSGYLRLKLTDQLFAMTDLDRSLQPKNLTMDDWEKICFAHKQLCEDNPSIRNFVYGWAFVMVVNQVLRLIFKLLTMLISKITSISDSPARQWAINCWRTRGRKSRGRPRNEVLSTKERRRKRRSNKLRESAQSLSILKGHVGVSEFWMYHTLSAVGSGSYYVNAVSETETYCRCRQSKDLWTRSETSFQSYLVSASGCSYFSPRLANIMIHSGMQIDNRNSLPFHMIRR